MLYIWARRKFGSDSNVHGSALKGYHVLHMDLSGSHSVAENHEGKEVLYAVVAVLRLQDSTHRRPWLLPWVKTAHRETR